MAADNFHVTIEAIKPLFSKRDKESHKGNFGIAGIWGGSKNYSGSIKLATLGAGALRGGCGVVRVIISEAIAPFVAPSILEQTLYILPDQMISLEQLTEACDRLTSLAIGMGWGKKEENRVTLTSILATYQGNLIIDADGLNTLATMDLAILKTSQAHIVLTPHVKEFSRLTGVEVATILADPISYAKAFAKEYEVIVLLKGATTIVTDGNQVYLVDRGSPGMATAGSGDVLSGILAGMLAYQSYSLLTVSAAAMLAGIAGELAAEKHTDIAMIASDTVAEIPNAIAFIRTCEVNENKLVYEYEGKRVGEVCYRYIDDNTIDIYHTYVDPLYRGHHIAANLMQGLFEQLKLNQKQATASCQYAKAWMQKHPEYQEQIK